jgi:hypothetical protein
LTILLLVDAQRAGGDDVDGEARKRDTGSGAYPFEPVAHDVQRILGRVQQDRPRLDDGESPQAAGAGGR